jgi:hypothetical protein
MLYTVYREQNRLSSESERLYREQNRLSCEAEWLYREQNRLSCEPERLYEIVIAKRNYNVLPVPSLI